MSGRAAGRLLKFGNAVGRFGSIVGIAGGVAELGTDYMVGSGK